MTRLEKGDIDHIARHLDEYDAHLKRVTSASLKQIACAAAGVEEHKIVDIQDRIRMAAVPISSGLGVIDGFCDAVAAIVSFIGFDTFVTEENDVAGIACGIENGADTLLLADDDRFVAIAPERKLVVDNSRATALGFVAALELMKGGLAGEPVLVLGCGSVGVAAAKALIDLGANVALCDIQQDRAIAAFRELEQFASDSVRMEDTPQNAIARYETIFDASNTGSFIEREHLTQRTIVAAPGMPCALTPDAMEKHRNRLIHDALEIGTATMAVQAAASFPKGAGTKKAAEQ
jgi:pyrrolysine biosynthesis protein PylD